MPRLYIAVRIGWPHYSGAQLSTPTAITRVLTSCPPAKSTVTVTQWQPATENVTVNAGA
jgi:hypothetical protein